MNRTPEYRHLLVAEKVMTATLELAECKASERSQCARALVDIIRLKRDMRGVPDPKPVDASQLLPKKRRSGNGNSPTLLPTDNVTPVQPSAAPTTKAPD